jgi:hypothetical protein
MLNTRRKASDEPDECPGGSRRLSSDEGFFIMEVELE